MIRDGYPPPALGMVKHPMASTHAGADVARPLQRADELRRCNSWRFWHLYLNDDRLNMVFGYLFTFRYEILDVRLDCLTNVAERFFLARAVAYAARKGWYLRVIVAREVRISLWQQYDRKLILAIFHGGSPFGSFSFDSSTRSDSAKGSPAETSIQSMRGSSARNQACCMRASR